MRARACVRVRMCNCDVLCVTEAVSVYSLFSVCRSNTWESQVPCPSTLHQLEPLCVATIQLCDGVIDCPLSEDEWPLTCALLKNVSKQTDQSANLDVDAQASSHAPSQLNQQRAANITRPTLQAQLIISVGYLLSNV